MAERKKRTMTAKQREVLERNQFKKGEDDERRHRPKKRMSFEACVALTLDQKMQGEDKSKRMALAERFVDELLRAQPKLMEIFLEREWPATQQIAAEVNHTGAGPWAEPFMSTEEAENERPDGRDRKDH